MKKLKVTAFAIVYNEEKRIESLLQNLMWAEEVIIYDKQSTDRTVEIAKRYTDRIVSIPYTDCGASGLFSAMQDASNEWLFPTTASGLIHPRLVREVEHLISDSNFKCDVIEVPYKIYSFGIHSSHSPWYDTHKPKFIKKSALIPSHELHNEISFTRDNVYKMPWIDNDAVCFHLTHNDINDFCEKVFRYTRYESQYLNDSGKTETYPQVFFQVAKSVGVSLLKRRVFLLGWDGVALGLGYLAYFIMKFLFIWDSQRPNGNVVYPKIRKLLSDEWDKYKSENS